LQHLNYHHLLYFWTVAREGSVTAASKRLHLTPQTLSGQIKQLEQVIGEPLFLRAGRGLVLSETGALVKQYADDIFGLGAELVRSLSERRTSAPQTLAVGIVDSIAKLIAYRLLRPALAARPDIQMVCREAELETLLADLAVHRLDLVISDRPLPAGLAIRAYNHPLGTSDVSIFAARSIASRYARRFPQSLNAAPMLLPAHSSALRMRLEDWFEQLGVRPHVVAECDDSALLKSFGEAGAGLFPAPTAIAAEIEHMYRARSVGRIPSVTERYYAISPERRLRHPGVLAVTESARERLQA
jgi:LysR family transcriptional activator of nhaA